MELWQQILALTLTPVMILAVVAYLLRQLLRSGLDKDLEKFKSELAIQKFQFQTRFSLIHEKRAEVLGELYARLDRTERALIDLTSLLQLNDGRTLKDKKAATSIAGKEFNDYYSTRKIYLDNNLCTQIEEIQKLMHDAWVAFDIAQDEENYKPDGTGLWRAAWKKVSEKLPPLKRQLEERFRRELGTVDGKQQD